MLEIGKTTNKNCWLPQSLKKEVHILKGRFINIDITL